MTFGESIRNGYSYQFFDSPLKPKFGGAKPLSGLPIIRAGLFTPNNRVSTTLHYYKKQFPLGGQVVVTSCCGVCFSAANMSVIGEWTQKNPWSSLRRKQPIGRNFVLPHDNKPYLLLEKLSRCVMHNLPR